MRIKLYYNKNLQMSAPKLAAQVGHVCKELGRMQPDSIAQDDSIVVLMASNAKFESLLIEMTNHEHHYVQTDNGLTEVPPGTKTVLGWVE